MYEKTRGRAAVGISDSRPFTAKIMCR
jgi:hypothetical protein